MRKILLILFLLSLLMDLDMLLSPTLIRHGVVQPHKWSAWEHTLFGSVEAVLIVGGTLLWLSMLYICWRYSGQGIVWRVLWTLVLFLAIWFGAQLYFIFPYRQAADRDESAFTVTPDIGTG